MSESRSHATTANKIAQKLGTTVNKEGVDIVTPNIAVEVETESTIKSGITQLQGHRKPSYIAVTKKDLLKDAMEITKNTTIGVMDKDGNIVKRSTRRKA